MSVPVQEQQKIVAVILVKNDKGEILLQRRHEPVYPEADGKWEFPGGRINFGELPHEAAERECLEEAGCTARVTRLLPVIQTRTWENTEFAMQVFVLCYEGRYLHGEPKPLDAKVSDVRWFTPEETENLELLVGIKDFIDLARSSER